MTYITVELHFEEGEQYDPEEIAEWIRHTLSEQYAGRPAPWIPGVALKGLRHWDVEVIEG